MNKNKLSLYTTVPCKNEKLSQSIANKHQYERKKNHLYGRSKRKYVTEPLIPAHSRGARHY